MWFVKGQNSFFYDVFAEDFTKLYGYSKIWMTDVFFTLAIMKFWNSAKLSRKI